MKTDAGETIVSDQSSKQRKLKSREVSSRFLSPISTLSTPTIESVLQSTNPTLSPLRQKHRASTDGRKHKSLESSGFIRGLWPSSGAPSSTPSNKKPDTLADHLGNAGLKDLVEHEDDDHKQENSMLLNRQRSCTELSRFENKKESKENHKPFFGGSMKYKGKFRFPGRSSASSSSSSSKSSSVVDDHNHMLPPRFSVDETALRRKSYARKSHSTLSADSQDTDSECSEICSGVSLGSPVVGKSLQASYMAPTVSSRKGGIEVSSKYINDAPARSRRWTIDSNAECAVSSDNPPKKFTIKDTIKRTNSLTAYRNATSKWALSPGRSSSPPMSAESKVVPMSFSSLKPPTSPSGPRPKGVGDFLSMGLELFKGKKSSSSTTVASPLGPGISESAHQLRLSHNRLVQWRYANAKADAVNRSLTKQAEGNLVHAWNKLAKLQHSVLQKKLQLEKEKLQMKLNFILNSQIKPLEGWGDMERQHLSAVSMTKDGLHSVVCRLPLIEGAQAETLSVSVAIRHASDLAASIKSMLATSSPAAKKTVSMLSELAEIVAEEKSLLEEFLELLKTISTLELQERSLKCNVIQLKLWHQQQQPKEILAA